MRHRFAGRHLGRTSKHRRALRRNMAASLIQHGAIRTTEPKAKELRRFVERLITIAKEDTLHARRRVVQLLQDRLMTDDEGELHERTVVQKLFEEVAPRYVDRPGGYVRIIRLSEHRIGDAGRQVLVQLVEEEGTEEQKKAKRSRRRQRAAKRYRMVEGAGGGTAMAAKTDTESDHEPPDEAIEAEDSSADHPAEPDEPLEQAEPSEPQQEARTPEDEGEGKGS